MDSSVKTELSDYGPEAITASEGWDKAPRWPWVDAVAWAATRDGSLMTLLRGARFFWLSAERTNPEPLFVEGVCRAIAQERIDEASWAKFDALLRRAAEEGAVQVFAWGSEDRVTPDVFAAPKPGSFEAWIGTPPPLVMVDQAAIKAIWPEPRATGDVSDDSDKSPSGEERPRHPRKRASEAAVRRWIEQQVKQGRSQRACEKAAASAFPDAPPARPMVRNIYKKVHIEKLGYAPMRGAPRADRKKSI